MDIKLSFSENKKGSEEGSNQTFHLNKVKSPEQAQEWAAKKIAAHVQKDAAQADLNGNGGKKETRAQRRAREIT